MTIAASPRSPIGAPIPRWSRTAAWSAASRLRATRRRPTCSRPFRRWCTRRCASRGRRSATAGARASRAPAPTPSTKCPGTRRSTPWPRRLRGCASGFGNTAILGGSYGWSSAGRVHHARSLLRRFLFLGGGCVDQVGNYSFGAAQYTAAARDRHVPAGGGRHHRLVVDRQAHAAHHRVRRARHQERPGHLGRGRRSQPGDVAAARQGRRHRVRLDQPAQVRCARIPRRAMDPDPAQHRYRADAGDGAHAPQRGSPRRAVRRALLRRLRALPPLSARPRRRRGEGRGMGGGDHRRRRRHHPRARAARRRDPQHDHLRVVAAARAPRRAAVLGGDRAGGDAGRHRASRRRLRVRPRLDQRHRRAARRCRGARGAAAAQPGAHDDPGRAHRRHAAQSRRELRVQRPPLHLSRHPADLLGGRQSVPPPPGPQPAAARLAEAARP